jgi:ribosomal protein L37AE/L43A
MPKREDEYSRERKETRGAALCPRCGSPNLSYNKMYKSWRCNRCEQSFPTPSYGAHGKPSWWDRLRGRG